MWSKCAQVKAGMVVRLRAENAVAIPYPPRDKTEKVKKGQGCALPEELGIHICKAADCA